MEETGRIIKTREGLAEVIVERKAACAGCGACRAVSDKEMVIEAGNDANAKVGDLVSVYLPEERVLEASALIYIVPLAAFFIGYFAGKTIAARMGAGFGEGAAILTAFLMLAGAFLMIKRYFGESAGQKGRYLPRITRIVKH